MMFNENIKETTKQVVKQNKLMESLNKKYNVIMHNDDITPMEYVICILVDVFEKDFVHAMDEMLKIHTQGSLVIGTYDMVEAYEKVEKVEDLNTEYGMDLLVTVEEN